ncbi:MAG: slipin family protein [Candidatus Omnitrophota bacterium]|nr:slipin family protein [Candidatus Omnitrophota bacterium]MBU2528300.1 slipin family protein [bacterium]MBU3929677.1 slipin family protein [bacterium]MBU4122634.1 slipin family protein [bacterium]
MSGLGGFFPLAVIVVIILFNAVRIVKEYERGVVFRLGRLVGARGPGLFFLIPGLEKMDKIDLRVITLDVPSQEVITKDNVPVKVNAVCYFRVMDPEKAIVEIEDFVMATSQISQTTLRSVIGQADLDEVLSSRNKINTELQKIIDQATDPWGIKVSRVEIKDVQLPADMQRAIARQAEAERDRRAKVIHAQGEFEASVKLTEAAKIIDQSPSAIQLRYLQTLTEIATENNSVTIFPVPIDILRAITQKKS